MDAPIYRVVRSRTDPEGPPDVWITHIHYCGSDPRAARTNFLLMHGEDREPSTGKAGQRTIIETHDAKPDDINSTTPIAVEPKVSLPYERCINASVAYAKLADRFGRDALTSRQVCEESNRIYLDIAP